MPASRSIQIRCLLLCCVLSCFICLIGCDSSGKSGKAPLAGKSGADSTSGNTKGESGESLEWPGLWRIEMTDEGIVHEFGIVKLEPASQANQFLVQTQTLESNYDRAVLSGSQVEGERINLRFDGGPDLEFSFEGTKGNSEVKGSLHIKGLHVSTMRMVKVEKDVLDGDPNGVPMEGLEVFAKLVGSPDGEDGLRDFIQQYPDNPIILKAYSGLAGFAQLRKAPVEEVKKLHEELLEQAQRWGGLVVPRASFEFGRYLGRLEYFPELAREYLSEFEKALTSETPKSWMIDLAAARATLGFHAEVIKQLGPLLEQEPENREARYTLSLAYEKSGDNDSALKGYLELAAMPLMDQLLKSSLEGTKTETLMDTVTRLWNAKHGNTNDLERALDAEFLTASDKKIPERSGKSGFSEKSRAVLVELFTGTACPPCVAADVAVAGIQDRYPSPEVIVIRHHLHIPAPDPLAVAEGEIRFNSYLQGDAFFQQHPEAVGTPSLFVNGILASGIAGVGLDGADQSYERVQEILSPMLRDTTDVKIALEATRSADKIQVKAAAAGAEFSANCRLHVLLVEDDLHFAAPNGIRVHDAIVRAYCNGAEGTAPVDQKLEFSSEISLSDVSGSINKYIAKIEEKSGRIFALPPKLEKLRIVAFVQDHSTREVLQTATVTLEQGKP